MANAHTIVANAPGSAVCDVSDQRTLDLLLHFVVATAGPRGIPASDLLMTLEGTEHDGLADRLLSALGPRPRRWNLYRALGELVVEGALCDTSDGVVPTRKGLKRVAARR